MDTTYVRFFDAPQALDKQLVGGKGANLAVLTNAGFTVPPGFCITTGAYTGFVETGSIGLEMKKIIAELDYDAATLETQTGKIRELILGGAVPDGMRAQIEAAYQQLGEACFVAVRSSGTAEDLAEASFAGLHDTYLDVRGVDALLDAVRRCWASMWTSRATAYRQNNGFDHGEAKLSVVVQQMIASEVSGVLFTGNPMTTATDEFVINASWGLGEAIVSGITDPDTFVARHSDLSVKEKLLGDKELSIQRADTDTGGTVEVDTPAEQRTRYCLTDDQVSELAGLGRRIQDHYAGVPQDIEWAYCDGGFYLLQSRPITGVEFSWDADVEAGHRLPDDENTTWTRALADEITTGVVTPLHYSIRYGGIYSNENWPAWLTVMGLPETAKKRTFKYHKAEVYYNADLERDWVENTTWKGFRSARLYWLPDAWREDVVNAPFSYGTYLRMWARMHMLEPNMRWNGMLTQIEHWRNNRRPDAEGLREDALRAMSDEALISYCEKQVAFESEWNAIVTPGFFIYYPELMNILNAMVTKWYTGTNQQAFIELVSGSDEQTDTLMENAALSAFAERIRNNLQLSELFARHQNGEFFAALRDSDAGREFLADYDKFIHEFGHRGHADRDLFYPRRAEDSSLDYQAFKIMLSGPPVDFEEKEHAVNRRRAATFAEVSANIAATPFGQLKASMFGFVYRLLHRFIPNRDRERANPGDLLNMSQKRGYREIGRRMVERGQIQDELDVLYITRWELYPWFRNTEPNVALLETKLAARKRDVIRFEAKEVQQPMWIRGGKPVDLSLGGDDTDGLSGVGTSPGSVTGIARVVSRLSEIGRVGHKEILVTHSTDPGWTPVFLIISGVVIETGGILSHASCVAREYGFPAVQLKGAMGSIPDGALIEINGTTGQVTILDPEPDRAVTDSAPAAEVVTQP